MFIFHDMKLQVIAQLFWSLFANARTRTLHAITRAQNLEMLKIIFLSN